MKLSNTVLNAIRIAVEAHEGQLDRQGKPYVLHPLRVGFAGRTENEMIVGFLHDTLEDTHLREHDIEKMFGTKVSEAVIALTRTADENSYSDHIVHSVALNDLAAFVKLNDLEDNLSPERMSTMAQAFQDRHIPKYREARAYLEAVVERKREPQS